MHADPTPTMIARLAHDLAFQLDRAAALARVAAGASRTREERIALLLDLEPQVFEAGRLIAAACLIHRRAASLDPPPEGS